MKGVNWRQLRLNAWQRRIFVGLAVAVTSQLYLSLWAEGFRVSTASVVYPLLLVIMMRDSHRPDTGVVTCLCVIAVRVMISMARGTELATALLIEYPGGIYYLCYDALLCFQLPDRRTAVPVTLWRTAFMCDLLSNLLNLALSSRLDLHPLGKELVPLMGVAMGRSLAAAVILYGFWHYRQLLMKEEHEQRYRQLYLMTAELKTELYFLKKDSEDMEAVMANAYRLYERLNSQQDQEELTALALSIARDVHEVKKDNLRIARGIEAEVAGDYDGENISLSDLLNILEVSTWQMLSSQRADIRLECHHQGDVPIRTHYRVLSILKNLVTNAVEAIMSDKGRGLVQVDCTVEGDELLLQVKDNGPGISERAEKMLFQVGYSTKFDPETGNINRGVGLPAVQYIVEELGGRIQVQSKSGQGACFRVALPLSAVTGGSQ